MLTKNDLEQIKQVVRGVFMPLDEKVGNLEKQGISIDLRLERVERKVDSVDLKLGEVEEKVDSIDARLGEVEKKVDNFASDVDELKVNVKAIHVIVTNDHDEFDKRIEKLEAHQN